MRMQIRGTKAVARLALALLLPVPALAQRQAPPAPGTPKDVRLAAKKTFALDNGMRVTLVPFGRIPMAALQLNVNSGAINEAASDVWLSRVTADMMKEGTATRTAEQVARDAASMGGQLQVSPGDDQTTLSGEVLSERAPDMARLIAEVAMNAKLPESELPRVKANLLRQMAIDKTVPQSIAGAKFQETMYGEHPYGRAYPTETQLNGFTVDQVSRFYRENLVASRSHLIVVGVYDAAALEQAIREAFTPWVRGSQAQTPQVGAGPSSRTVTLLDRADAPQSTLNLGIRIPAPRESDYIPIRVADRLLGGSFGSRITKNLREEKGYTYSPYSFTSARQQSTYWQQAADVTTKDTGNSLKEIFAEIDRLQKEAPPQDEVRRIQNEMVGIFALQNASRSGIAGRLTFADLHGVGDAYLTNFVKNIMAVTPADVQRMATTYLRPDRMTLIVVGDKKTVEPQLAPWATVVP